MDCGDHAADGGAVTTPGNSPPPAQAAVAFKVSPTGGKQCPPAGAFLGFPSSATASVVGELSCDLSADCKPDQYVVVDRQDGANVNCSVTANGPDYALSASLDVDGAATGGVSVRFDVSGIVSPTGGTVALTENNSAYGGGGADPACTVTIAPAHGAVGAGKVWATFSCSTFRDANDISDTQCLAEGAFLFENCAH
jgi:hypothetical protein